MAKCLTGALGKCIVGIALLQIFTPPLEAAARSTKIVFINKTTHVLELSQNSLSHGEWTVRPPKTIPAKGQVTWASESNGFMTGTEGRATYKIQGGGQIYLMWDNPYHGSNSYDGSWPESGYQLLNSGGSGNNTTITWTFETLVLPPMPRIVINKLDVRVVTSKQHLSGSDNFKYFDIGPLGWELVHNGHHGHDAGSDITHSLDLHGFKGILTTDDIVWLRLQKKGILGVNGSSDGLDGAWRPHAIYLLVNDKVYFQFYVDQWLRAERPTWEVIVRPRFSIQERFAHALRLIPNNRIDEFDKLNGVVMTNLFKKQGISGWKPSGVPVAVATGTVVYQKNSTDGLATIDLAVEKVALGGKTILMNEKNGVEHPRFLRVEYEHKKNPVPKQGQRVEIGGNVVWDTDSEWHYEIHPRGASDVKILP